MKYAVSETNSSSTTHVARVLSRFDTRQIVSNNIRKSKINVNVLVEDTRMSPSPVSLLPPLFFSQFLPTHHFFPLPPDFLLSTFPIPFVFFLQIFPLYFLSHSLLFFTFLYCISLCLFIFPSIPVLFILSSLLLPFLLSNRFPFLYRKFIFFLYFLLSFYYSFFLSLRCPPSSTSFLSCLASTCALSVFFFQSLDGKQHRSLPLL